MTEIHIASLIVRARTETIDLTQGALKALGFAVHAVADGKIIATLECQHPRQMMQMTDDARNAAGVVAADVVYHHCESAKSLEEPIP